MAALQYVSQPVAAQAIATVEASGPQTRRVGFPSSRSRYRTCCRLIKRFIMSPAPIVSPVFPRVSKRAHSAFTLVEMMIVVAIVGLLAAIAIPSFVHARETALNNRFAVDLRVARDAFIEYSADNRKYPPDTMPGVVPIGMADYLFGMHWTQPTAIGGQWDWDNGQFGFKAGVSVYQPTASLATMQKFDAIIDDGNLTTGTFRARTSGYISIIEE
jgi:prepilin-type N-terminal cleavage/methylation domain-containing protein